jgi:hypothetical protein
MPALNTFPPNIKGWSGVQVLGFSEVAPLPFQARGVIGTPNEEGKGPGQIGCGMKTEKDHNVLRALAFLNLN